MVDIALTTDNKEEVDGTIPVLSIENQKDRTSDSSSIDSDTSVIKKTTIGISDLPQNLTPLQQSDIEWRQSETAKNKAKTACWNALKPSIVVLFSIVSVLLVLLGIFWAYQISSISEPIGGIKDQISNLNKYNDEEVKPRLKEWDSTYTQLKIKKIILP